jgi:transposase-like protein
VLNGIRNRGTEDILIACMDGLTGFPDAVRAVFPDTRIQRCIVHMVRSSTRFVSYKDLKAVCAGRGGRGLWNASGRPGGPNTR